jgi:hypothetical protein
MTWSTSRPRCDSVRSAPHIAIAWQAAQDGGDGRVTRHIGYAISQRCASASRLAKVKLRGRIRVEAVFTPALANYNFVRLPRLLAALV